MAAEQTHRRMRLRLPQLQQLLLPLLLLPSWALLFVVLPAHSSAPNGSHVRCPHVLCLILMALVLCLPLIAACFSLPPPNSFAWVVLCPSRNLTTVPPEIAENGGPVHLDLDNNFITELAANLVPGGPVSSLMTIILSNNRLTRVDENAFNSLSVLSTLALDGNFLTQLTLPYLPKLEKLSVGRNYLTGCPLFSGTQIRYLFLQENYITSLNRASFSSLSASLVSLNISGNLNPSILANDTFSSMITLTNLYMSNLSIQSLPEIIFDDYLCSTIQYLDLSYNNLTDLPSSLERCLTAKLNHL